MNYSIQLVTGRDAAFFLTEWEAGGVEIDETLVGLFNAAHGSNERVLAERLSYFDLAVVRFSLAELLKIGLLPEWVWKRVRWQRVNSSPSVARLKDALEREVLGPGLLQAKERQIRLLKLVQAINRVEGLPTRIDGEVEGLAGRTERVVVFRSGVVAYDRTPHPLPFLRALGRVITLHSSA